VTTVLIVFDSRGGLTEQLAESVAEGVRSVEGVHLRYCRAEETPPEELASCDALIIGSPNYSGVTGKLKSWLDHAWRLWEDGALVGKVGGVFAAGWSRSAGTEATLLQLLHFLLANGVIVVGLPWSERMRRSGSYYGATAHGEVTEDDREQARALGRRVAELAARLSKAPG
jgi:NAD(P)H dehydrogenase (quinone)